MPRLFWHRMGLSNVSMLKAPRHRCYCACPRNHHLKTYIAQAGGSA